MIGLYGRLKNVYSNMSLQVKASLWFVMSTVLLKGISFITVPIFTRIMTTEEYGLYSVYLTWCEMFTIIGTFGLESCAYVSALTKFNEGDKNEAQSSLLGLSFVLTSALLIIFLIGGRALSNFIGLPQHLLMLMVCQIYFIPSLNFWLTKSRFQYKYKSLVFVSISMAILNALIGLIFVLNIDKNMQAFGRIVSIVIVQVLYGVILFCKLQKNNKINFTTKYWKWAIFVHLPLLPHILSLKVLSGVDRIMINSLVGASAAALYSASYSIAVVVNLVKTSIVDAMRPWIYNCLKENKTESIKSVTDGVLVLVALLTLVFVAFAPEVIKIATPVEYYEAVYCMPPVMISSFFTFMYSIFSVVEMYFEETKKIMYASIIAAIINIILNLVFIKMFGYIAAAFTTLICYIFLSIFHFIVANRVMKKNSLNMDLFGKKSIILISLVLIILMFIFEYLYLFPIYRYIFLCIIMLVMFIKRNYFIGLVKEIRKK